MEAIGGASGRDRGPDPVVGPAPTRDEGSAFDRAMMARALVLAAEARDCGEVPVGALVVRSGRIISQAYNLRETLRDPTAHAERLALTWAGRVLNSWRLEGCVLYVTLEPCAMCAGAIVLGRIARLVYGARDPKAGACESLFRLASDPRLNHRPAITAGVLAVDCGEILRGFFQERRGFRRMESCSLPKNSGPGRAAPSAAPDDLEQEGCLSG